LRTEEIAIDDELIRFFCDRQLLKLGMKKRKTGLWMRGEDLIPSTIESAVEDSENWKGSWRDKQPLPFVATQHQEVIAPDMHF
jgi:hypothetical protein